MLRHSANRLRTAVAGQCTRGLASGAGPDAPPPTYTYLPPGCSMREPAYFSLSDPVYFYDMPPAHLAAGHQQQPGSTVAEESAPQGAKPAAAGSAGGLRAAFDALSGQQSQRQAADKRPHSYKMVDELSQQPYVVSANHSMRDPKYVSMTDPKYQLGGMPQAPPQKQAPAAATKQQQQQQQQGAKKQQGAK